MEYKCWYHSNFDLLSQARPSWTWPDHDLRLPLVWCLTPNAMFDDDILASLCSQGLPLLSVLLFYKPPWFSNWAAHIDTYFNDPGRPSVAGFNTVFDTDDSDFVWYETPAINGATKRTMAGTPFFEWPITQLREVTRHCLGPGMTMVRTDIPHAIAVRSQARKSISFRIDIQHDSWQEAVDFYLSKGIIYS